MDDRALYRAVRESHGMAQLLALRTFEAVKGAVRHEYVTVRLAEGRLRVRVGLPWYAWLACGAWHVWTRRTVQRTIVQVQSELKLFALPEVKVS